MKKLLAILTFLMVGSVSAQVYESDMALQKRDKDPMEYLSLKQVNILKRGFTERAWSSDLNSEKRKGVYVSVVTGEVLFTSDDKFDSRTGWPSFDKATVNVMLGPKEQGGYEIIEATTGYHLGHVFYNEGFTDENVRYCVNGSVLTFIPHLELNK